MKKQISRKLDPVSKTSLSARQSVRTTFRLGESANDAINWLIKTNGLKPKEVFDLICSNESLVEFAVEATKKNNKSGSTNRTRKTFVISKQVLRLLNKLSEEQEVSRDLIVENLILLFRALLEKHSEEEKKKEEKAYAIISDFWGRAEELEKQLKELLDDDSPILDRFGLIVVVIMNLALAIKSKLSDDVPIDPDDMSQS